MSPHPAPVTTPPASATPRPAKPLRIVRLSARNIMGLKAVEITPQDAIIYITGKNASGKTSVLSTIPLALDATEAQKQIPQPIRQGETHARIDLDLEEIPGVPASPSSLDVLQQAVDAADLDPDKYHVTRTFTPNHNYLTVRGKDGKDWPSPQMLLNSFIGDLSFDPLAFARMPPEKQRGTLLPLLDLPVDLDALEARRAALYTERTQINRDLKQHEGALASLPPPAGDLPETELSATALIAEIQAAQAQQLANAALRRELADLRAEARTALDGLAELDRQLRDLQSRREKRQQDYELIVAAGKERASQVEGLTDPDLAPRREALATLETRNTEIRDAQRYRALQRQVETTQAESDRLTAALAEIDHTKAEALRTATFPIPGLSVSEDAVTFQGIPLKQCSRSEQLRVSLATAMALNKRLRVIRSTDGSLLDRENLALIEEMVQDQEYQLWIETVDDTGTVGIQIEDGLVKKTPPGSATVSPTAAQAPAAKPAELSCPAHAQRPAPHPPAPSAPPAPANPPAVPGAPPPTPRPATPHPLFRTPTYATRSGPKGR